jgi:enoyl-CoA hydratase/carnithine racemase
MPIVTTEDRGPVRHVVLDRPEKRNAFNEKLVLGVGDALRAAAADPAVLCVVIRGAGPMFSAGMDINSLGALAEDPDGGRLRAFRGACLAAWNAAEEMTKPVIGQIHGGCIGGAMELALACDLRVMAENAVIGLVETRVGLIPDVGGCSRLPAVVGLGRAKELVMTSRVIGGVEAERIGLVNRVAPADELDAATERLVGELLACAPVAVGLAKRVLDAAAKPALAVTLEHEVTAQTVCAASADFAEGTRALAEKRPPAFAGR